MGRLGDALEAIYQAPRLTGALHARAHQVQDIEQIRVVHEWWSRRRPHGSALGQMLMVSSGGGGGHRHETDHELWRRDEAHWRADAASWVTVLTDDAVLSYSPGAGAVRNPDREQAVSVWDPVLRPRWLLAWYDLDVGDDVRVAGRSCWSATLTPTWPTSPMGLGMPRWFGSEVRCTLDQVTGVVLSYVARHEGAVVDSWTTTNFEILPAIEDSVFAFTPPDGSAFRDRRRPRSPQCSDPPRRRASISPRSTPRITTRSCRRSCSTSSRPPSARSDPRTRPSST
jgi:hypothetical protein